MAADQFNYLGSTLFQGMTVDTEINCRIAKASSAFDRLCSNMWEHGGTSAAIKLKVYRAMGTQYPSLCL